MTHTNHNINNIFFFRNKRKELTSLICDEKLVGNDAKQNFKSGVSIGTRGIPSIVS